MAAMYFVAAAENNCKTFLRSWSDFLDYLPWNSDASDVSGLLSLNFWNAPIFLGYLGFFAVSKKKSQTKQNFEN